MAFSVLGEQERSTWRWTGEELLNMNTEYLVRFTRPTGTIIFVSNDALYVISTNLDFSRARTLHIVLRGQTLTRESLAIRDNADRAARISKRIASLARLCSLTLGRRLLSPLTCCGNVATALPFLYCLGQRYLQSCLSRCFTFE